MNILVASIVYALSASIAWGVGDFVSGLTARRIGPLLTLMLSLPIGFVAALLAALVTAEAFTSWADLGWGILGGLVGTVGYVAMLRGFAVGRMGVVSPVAAAVGAVVPVLFAILSLGVPGQQQLLGFGVALLSIWLISPRGGAASQNSGLGLALLAGLGFGLFFTALGQISAAATFWPLAASRLVSSLALAAVWFAGRSQLPTRKLPVGLLIGSGIGDVLGNFLFLRAVQAGRLDIAAVLVSLYPGITVLLARIIEKEHLSRLQVFGVLLALLAVALITV
ncbi:MAG: EamA family transporter [Anaerolineales bacterium]|nr:EamA family transporter [Anaerolineales bacterium]